MTQPAARIAHILEARAMRPSVALGRSRASPAVFVRRKSRGTGDDSLDDGWDSGEVIPAAAKAQVASATEAEMLIGGAVAWSCEALLGSADAHNEAVAGMGDCMIWSAELSGCMAISPLHSLVNHRS